jgi:glycosyltransferase involved in cell wall biosynthesis
VVTLICPEQSVVDPLAERVRQDGVEVRRLTLSLQVGFRHCIGNLRKTVGLLRESRTEVLHLHLTGYTGGRWALLAARLACVPAVLCTLQIVPEQRSAFHLRLEWRVLGRSIDWIVAVSEITRQRLVDFLDLPANKVVVVPNAVELDRYAQPDSLSRIEVLGSVGIPASALVIGSAARLAPQKGLSYLIDAVPEICAREPTVHVVLIGDGPLRAQLEAQADRLGVEDRVHFVGFTKDVPRWLNALDVFVLPSLFEGLPLSILEAMAAGLPVVATAVDGTPEAVDDGVTGILIPPEDSRAIAEAVLRLLQNPKLRTEQGRAARERAGQFSLETLAQRISGLYGVSLEQRRRGSR